MNSNVKPDPDMSMDDIMRKWPDTIGVLIRHGMLCVGCPIVVFHTRSAEAFDEHGVDKGSIIRQGASSGDPGLKVYFLRRLSATNK